MVDPIYQTLIDAANDMIFVHPLEAGAVSGNFQHVNELACSRLGYSREELLSFSPRDITPEGDLEKTASAGERLLRDGKLVFEKRLVTKAGEVVPVEISTRLVEIDGVDLAFSFVRDITERVQAKEALAASERRFRSLTQATPAYLFEIDPDGRIRFVNRTYPGLTSKDVVGTYLTDWFSPELKPEIADLVRKAFETGDAHSIEYTLPDLQGKPISYVAKIGPVWETESGPVALLTAVECQLREPLPGAS